jgi:hypothetical protein
MKAVEEFERMTKGFLDESSPLSKYMLSEYERVTTKADKELDADSYLRVLHLWQEAFDYLVAKAFPEMTISELLDNLPQKEIKEAKESEWLRRFDFVEGAIRYIILGAETAYCEDVLDILTAEAMEALSAGEVLESFMGTWAVSLDGEVSMRAQRNRFLLCERGLVTDTLYSAKADQGVEQQWWIGPKNVKPLTLAFPFDMVRQFISPSDVRYRSGIRSTPYDMRLRLVATERGSEENRLPVVLSALGALKHMVIFEEADFNISIARNDGESDAEYAARKAGLANVIKDQLQVKKKDIGYSISLVVEGPAEHVTRRVVSHVFAD